MKANNYIPHVELTPEQQAPILQKMREGSSLIRSLHEKAKKQFVKANPKKRFARKHFRMDLFKALDAFRSRRGVRVLPNQMWEFNGIVRDASGDITIHGITIPAADIQTIQVLRLYQDKMLQAYSKAIYTVARWWWKENQTFSLSDFYDEAVLAAIEAFYGYNKSSVKFHTYLVHALNRKLITFISANTGTTSMTTEDRELLTKFTKQKSLAESKQGNEPISFDDMVRRMKLTPDQRNTLVAILHCNTVPFAVLSDSSHDTGGRPVTIEENVVARNPEIDFEERDAIQNADLSDMERAVLEAFRAADNGQNHGWITEFTRNYLKPDGSRYSRMTPILALRRAKEKIVKAYRANKAA